MGKGLSLQGYSKTLIQLIYDIKNKADLYTVAARNLSGDNKDLLMRIASEHNKTAHNLESICRDMFCHCNTPYKMAYENMVTIKDLIALETQDALHLSHMAKTAPNKLLFDAYTSMAQKATNHGYLLLLIL